MGVLLAFALLNTRFQMKYGFNANAVEQVKPGGYQAPSFARSTLMKPYTQPTRLDSVSIILPVINETVSLRKTIDTILKDVKRELIREFIIVVCKRTTPDAMTVIGELQKEFGELVVVLHQKLPFLGGALRDAFDVARGSHTIMMGSDLETNPDDVHNLIEAQQKAPSTVITTSRWIRGGEFHGYSPVKLLCNWIFQRFFSLIYWTRLTDMTYGFRIMPTALAQAIQWEEVRHPFNLENIIKPLRLGIPVSEIPTVWSPRIEGESQNPFFRNFEYFRIGFKARFSNKNSFWRS
ncbi:MAG TPA: glycosyltransferase family 2 protein [Verrucomicrobiae bacterium]|jgi:glycosyltransferase involved in cell wall biosynthesis|nr:glycosyltransferase family 2 protein [Verrucomicrobiae bacterium]